MNQLKEIFIFNQPSLKKNPLLFLSNINLIQHPLRPKIGIHFLIFTLISPSTEPVLIFIFNQPSLFLFLFLTNIKLGNSALNWDIRYIFLNFYLNIAINGSSYKEVFIWIKCQAFDWMIVCFEAMQLSMLSDVPNCNLAFFAYE